MAHDIIDTKREFPILNKKVGGRPLILLDSPISTPIPADTIQSVSKLLSYSYYDNLPNAEAGVHQLAKFHEETREKARVFINAKSTDEIYFTLNSTLASNALAEQIARTLSPADEILISPHDYSSTYAPWQDLAKRYRLNLRHPTPQKDRIMNMEEYESMLHRGVKVVCLNALSTYTGLTLDIKKCTRLAHKVGAIVIVDASFACAHMKIDVQDLDCDFIYLSGYKMYSFTGVSCVYGKKEHLLNLGPVLLGPDTKEFSTSHFIPLDLPGKNETGLTTRIPAYSMGCGFDFINKIGGLDAIMEHEKRLQSHLTSSLKGIPGVRILDSHGDRIAITSFVIDGISNNKIQQFLNNRGIYISFRTTGQAPNEFFKSHGITSHLRSGVGVHNTLEDIDRLVDGIYEAKAALSPFKSKNINIETNSSGSLDIIKLDAPKLGANHIGTKEVGFRPYNTKGPNLDVVSMGEKTVFNNYSHASTGWSMGPATSNEVVNKIKTHFKRNNLEKDEPIVVVGAGIIGSLTAAMLVNDGFTGVRMVAKEISNTTSHIASGHFTPELYALNTEYVPRTKAEGWIKFSYNFWKTAQEQKHDFINCGVRMIPAFIFGREELIGQGTITDVVFSHEKVMVDFGSIKHEMHVTENYLAFETSDVMLTLRQYLLGRVPLEQAEVKDLNELKESVIVNCAGLGNIELTKDGDMQSVLGHHLYLRNQKGLDLDYVVRGTMGPDYGNGNGLEFLAKRDPNPTSAYDLGLLGNSLVYDTRTAAGYEMEFDNILSRMRKFFNSY